MGAPVTASPATTGGVLERARGPLRGTIVHREWRRLRSAVGSRGIRSELGEVETYTVFLGHSRSGHSIVGALLDAHPQIVISDELDALSLVQARFSRDQVLYLSILVARHQAARERRKEGRGGRTYSYHVPGQSQGHFDALRVVGDSRAGWSTRRLHEDPDLLERVESLMRPSVVKFIHVVRNPFDNISTMMLRGGRSQENARALYVEGCRRLLTLRARIPAERLMTLRHEDLLADPVERLRDACRFLGVEPSPVYLEAAAGILFTSPSRSRDSVTWTPTEIAQLEATMRDFDFLDGYHHAE